MSDADAVPTSTDDTPPLPVAPDEGEPEQGDNQDVPARRIYPTDPTGADPA